MSILVCDILDECYSVLLDAKNLEITSKVALIHEVCNKVSQPINTF